MAPIVNASNSVACNRVETPPHDNPANHSMSIYGALETITVETILIVPVDLDGRAPSSSMRARRLPGTRPPLPLTARFDIVIRYHGDPQYQAAFASAAARWSQIIVGDITDIFVNNPQYSLNQTIDDLLIDATSSRSTGRGNISDRPDPDLIRSSGSRFRSTAR